LINNSAVQSLLGFLFLAVAVTLPVILVSPVLAGDYTIGAGDVLSITVFDHDELTAKVRVSENGNIEFPLIGGVRVGGLKISAASAMIVTSLANGYIVDPQVTIFIEQFKSKKVIVLGHVKNPGMVELHGPTSLLELISQVGGLEKDAGETVSIKREVDGAPKIITIDLASLIKTGDTQKNIPILGGDTVSIAQGAVCYITGAVKNPGEYPCGRNTTLFKIISLAGSFTEKALETGVTINRVVNGTKQILRGVHQNMPVRPEDVIVVPLSPAAKEKNSVCYITGEVNRPGAYPCDRKTNVLKMLTRAGSFTDNALQTGITINRVVNGTKQILRGVNQNTLVRPEDVIVVSESFAKKESVCYITGQVNRPGAYPCGRTTTVLKMISLAGSFTGIASESGVRINRVVNGEKQVLKKVDLDTPVQADDVIVVPESFF
jgi:polysaccharide export outer membrane protein